MGEQVFRTSQIGLLGTPPPLDARLAARSARQYRILTAYDLRTVGLSPNAIRKRVARGALHRLYPGIYAVGDPLIGLHGRWLAAVRACGSEALLSHRDAAMLWGLLRSSRRRIDVTAPTQRGRKLEGIDHHRALLLPRDVAEHEGIPCTSVARTLLDLAAVVAGRPLERAYEQGWVLGLLGVRALEDVLARAAGHHGAARLRALVDRHHGRRTATRSDLEELFLSLVDRAGLERPELNVQVPIPGEELEVDCLWRAERLVVELDSRRYHRDNPLAFSRDRRRDRVMRLAGYEPVRFTDEELSERPGEVIEAVIAFLRARSSSR